MDKVELYERSDGKFDWRRRAANGQIISNSANQGFSRKIDARASIISQFGPDVMIEDIGRLEDD